MRADNTASRSRDYINVFAYITAIYACTGTASLGGVTSSSTAAMQGKHSGAALTPPSVFVHYVDYT